MISRYNSSKTEQSVPTWAGCLSATSDTLHQLEKIPRCQTIDYMAQILFPIMETVTVQHILEESQKATQSVGQEFIIVTFDLGVTREAFNIVWQNERKSENVSIRIGVFHTMAPFTLYWKNI